MTAAPGGRPMTVVGGHRPDPSVLAGAGAAAVAAAVVLAPWWRPGALLVRDLVAVADPAWSTALLGGAQRLPRDVPGEALVALAGQVVPGDVVVRVVLLAALVALGAGVGSALGRGSWPAAVAGLVAVWNPFVLARLHQGQWLVVVALAAVPWVVVHVTTDDRARLARTLVLAGLTGFLAPVVVGPTLVAVAAMARRWRALAVGAGVSVLTALPWLLVAGPVVADPDGWRAFAPSADLPAGVLPSLVSGGGYFNTAVASPWRGRWPVAVLALLLTALAVWGVASWVRAEGPRWRARGGLVVVGVATLLLAAGTATSPGQQALATLGEALPAAAVLRDSQRLLAPWVVLLAIGAGAAVHELARRAGEAPAITVAMALLVVVALPDPLLGPRLPPPSTLPASWHQAAAEVEDDPAAVLVVPHGQTQRYPFTDGRPVAVPLRRLVAAPVLTDTRLVVGTASDQLVVDDRAGGEAARDLAGRWPGVDAAELTAAGIGWVAVTDPALFGSRPPGTTPVVASPTLELVHVDREAAQRATEPSGAVLATDLVVGLLAVVLLLLPVVRRANGRPGGPPRPVEDG